MTAASGLVAAAASTRGAWSDQREESAAVRSWAGFGVER